MSDNDLIRRGDALAAVRTSDFRWDAEEAIAALPAVTVPVVSQPVRYCPICDIADCATHRPVAAPVPLKDKLAAMPQERRDRIKAEADRLAALDELARLGQEFDAEAEAGGSIIQGLREAAEYTRRMLVDADRPDPAAIREAALREAARVADRFADRSIVDAAFWRKDGMPNTSVISEEHAKAARLISEDILALIQKGAAE